jgi:tritrans,polycis-undecaprenyl-diphosphate synthase [geranylgeranyl-diphosphate specific]
MLSGILRLLGIYRVYGRTLEREILGRDPPKHIGFILDGNRRWAHRRSLSLLDGHARGADTSEELLDWCHDLGVDTVTLYTLSMENLERSAEEVEELFELFGERFTKLLGDGRIHKYRIRVKALGRVELLPDGLRDLLSRLEESTKDYSDRFLNIAIAYGGRVEITDGVKEIANLIREEKLSPEDITPSIIEQHLYTSHLPNPEPDLIIRTSGEERLSGFLLWQSAYSELVFIDAFWPEFRKIDLMRAIRTYQRRKRNFGK